MDCHQVGDVGFEYAIPWGPVIRCENWRKEEDFGIVHVPASTHLMASDYRAPFPV